MKKGKERKGRKERKGKERKGKERKGKRKGKESKTVSTTEENAVPKHKKAKIESD